MKPKLLVIELWGVGDLAVATPFLRAASERFDVTLLGKPHALELQPHFWPEVKVEVFNAPWTAFQDKYRLGDWPWREMDELRSKLKTANFDFGVSVRCDPRDHLLLYLSGVKERLGFPRLGSAIFLTSTLSIAPDLRHRYDFWKAAGMSLGLELLPQEQLPLPPAKGKTVLIHSGARLPARRWPLERYAEIAHRLRAAGFPVQVACDPEQKPWWQERGETGIASPHTLGELLSLIKSARVFIGNCSGPGHLAAISGLPTFTVFGPSLPEEFLPIHPSATFVETQSCPYRPCADYCRFDAPKCLLDLSIEQVWNHLKPFVYDQTSGL